MLLYMGTAVTQKKRKRPELRLRVYEEAREAVATLWALRPLLSPQDAETLAILMDKDLIAHLEKSMTEAAGGKTEPLRCILT